MRITVECNFSERVQLYIKHGIICQSSHMFESKRDKTGREEEVNRTGIDIIGKRIIIAGDEYHGITQVTGAGDGMMEGMKQGSMKGPDKGGGVGDGTQTNEMLGFGEGSSLYKGGIRLISCTSGAYLDSLVCGVMKGTARGTGDSIGHSQYGGACVENRMMQVWTVT